MADPVTESTTVPSAPTNPLNANPASSAAFESNADSGRSSAPPANPVLADFVDRRIIMTVSALLILLAALTVACLALEWTKYKQALEVAVQQLPPDHAAALSYARALDAATIKTSALMLAFIVVFVGALYVLRTTTAAFNLGLAGKGFNGTLSTSSPGLVMITLGLAIVAIAVLSRSDINYNAPSYSAGSTAPALPPDDNEEVRGLATPTLKLKPDANKDGGQR